MLSPSMYSPPRSLHRSMRIFHCWKQCCRSSSDSLFMSSVAFAFTASTDLVPFNADLTYRWGGEGHMGLGQVTTVMFQQCDLVLRQKLLDRQGVVCRCVVLVKNPRAIFFSPVHKVCQNLLVVDLVNGLTFRHPIHMNNPSDVEKKRPSSL
jgi:hypothetical protein